jgi:hypothetical protein
LLVLFRTQQILVVRSGIVDDGVNRVETGMIELEMHDPSGRLDITKDFAPRLGTLDGKKIALLSGDQWQAHRTLPMLKALFEHDFPSIEVLPIDAFPSGEHAVGADTTVQMIKDKGVDGVVIGNAACGSCSTALGRAAAKLEGEGIPTVLFGRSDFLGVVRNAVSGMGLPSEAAVVAFPVDIFLPDSDLQAIEDRKDEFYAGLTTWRSKSNFIVSDAPPMISVKADDYPAAFTAANNLLLTSRWGDGLPAFPPTKDRVDWILRGTDQPRDQVLGKVMPRGGIATTESCAVALAMAGGRPEYLPVLLAAVEAFLDPLSDSEHMQADSNGAFPVVVVNGPIAKKIRLNGSFGCLGPDPQRPAGASIGRALRLIQQNLGGALPGVGAMAMWGAMRYTNAVFAEDEDGLPNCWLPHATERHGFEKGENSISLLWATGVTNIRRRSATTQTVAEDALQGMHRMADYLRSPNLGSLIGYKDGAPGVLMLSPVVANAMAAVGWTKKSIREFIWEHTKTTKASRTKNGFDSWLGADRDELVRESASLDMWPSSMKPENLVLLVAGGGHPTNSHWMEAYSPNVVGRKIMLSEAHDALLVEADRDLGSSGEACQL